MNTARELTERQIRQAKLQAALDAPEAQRRALERELAEETARIAALQRQESATAVESELSQARQIGAGNLDRVKDAHAALDAIAAILADLDRSALDAMEEAAESQRRALDGALSQIEARFDAQWTPAANVSEDRARSEQIRAEVRTAAATVPRAYSARDAIILWIQAAPPDQKAFRQKIGLFLTEKIWTPAPDWQPESRIDPYRR